MTITINNTEIQLKYGFKALMMFENIMEKAFSGETLGEVLMLFYCCVIARNETIKYEDFLDWCDENPNALDDFSEYLSNTLEAITLKKAKGKESK